MIFWLLLYLKISNDTFTSHCTYNILSNQWKKGHFTLQTIREKKKYTDKRKKICYFYTFDLSFAIKTYGSHIDVVLVRDGARHLIYKVCVNEHLHFRKFIIRVKGRKLLEMEKLMVFIDVSLAGIFSQDHRRVTRLRLRLS